MRNDGITYHGNRHVAILLFPPRLVLLFAAFSEVHFSSVWIKHLAGKNLSFIYLYAKGRFGNKSDHFLPDCYAYSRLNLPVIPSMNVDVHQKDIPSIDNKYFNASKSRGNLPGDILIVCKIEATGNKRFKFQTKTRCVS